jgi:hypothetical protein
MPNYGYLVVEGPHDIEFIYRVLKPLGFAKVEQFDELDDFMKLLVPREYPHKGNLLKRVPSPTFLRNPLIDIAILSATGDSNLVKALDETRELINLRSQFDKFSSIGIILDSDLEKTAAERYFALRKLMQDMKFDLPDSPAAFTNGRPKFGAFVIPDNQNPGNLEDLLLECAQQTYPDLIATAVAHVEAAKSCKSLKKDGENLSKASQYNKAVVGSIANVLRPGKSVQVSIHDNKWLAPQNLSLDRIKAFQDFLVRLFELSISHSHPSE